MKKKLPILSAIAVTVIAVIDILVNTYHSTRGLFGVAYTGLLSFIVGSIEYTSGIVAAVIWILLAIVVFAVISKKDKILAGISANKRTIIWVLCFAVSFVLFFMQLLFTTFPTVAPSIIPIPVFYLCMFVLVGGGTALGLIHSIKTVYCKKISAALFIIGGIFLSVFGLSPFIVPRLLPSILGHIPIIILGLLFPMLVCLCFAFGMIFRFSPRDKRKTPIIAISSMYLVPLCILFICLYPGWTMLILLGNGVVIGIIQAIQTPVGGSPPIGASNAQLQAWASNGGKMPKQKSAAGAMVKGAVVGNIIGGQAGAVVGAMVAKEKHNANQQSGTAQSSSGSAAKSMVKGAVVGSIIGGDAGAVVGAMVGKEKHDNANN